MPSELEGYLKEFRGEETEMTDKLPIHTCIGTGAASMKHHQFLKADGVAYGRTSTRWDDFEKDEKLVQKSFRVLLRKKLDVELEARKNWPMYAFMAEDLKLRNQNTWPVHFPPEKRTAIYMHDNTNVPLSAPSDPDLQAIFFSEYYAMCCAKGGVAVQQCGWIRTLPLCTGAIGDQEYLSKTKTFEKQKQLAEADNASDEPGINVLD